MKRKEPVAVTQAIQLLVKLGDQHGIEVIHTVYAEAVAEMMGARERDAWRVKITEAQGEFALLGHE